MYTLRPANIHGTQRMHFIKKLHKNPHGPIVTFGHTPTKIAVLVTLRSRMARTKLQNRTGNRHEAFRTGNRHEAFRKVRKAEKGF